MSQLPDTGPSYPNWDTLGWDMPYKMKVLTAIQNKDMKPYIVIFVLVI